MKSYEKPKLNIIVFDPRDILDIDGSTTVGGDDPFDDTSVDDDAPFDELLS